MPTIAEAFDAAVKLHDAGELTQADRLYREVLKADPRHALACHNLGLVAQARGDVGGAIEWVTRAIKINGARASYHNNLGALLQSQSRLADAIASYNRALAIEPRYAEALSNLGSAYKDQGDTERAIDYYHRSLDLKSDLAPAHFNLGVIHQQRGELTEAAERYQVAIRSRARYWQAYNNLGTVYKSQGRFREALECYEAALGCGGDVAEAHRNRALLRLLSGNFEGGWPEYEWRWRVSGATRITFPQPRWDGRPLPGRTVLMKAEQGLGDTIQFVRYAPLIKERAAGQVLLQCAPALHRLLANIAGVDRLAGEPIERETFDAYVPLLSLPAVFETRLETIPAQVPYLFAESDRVARCRKELGGDKSFKVGIAWQGNPGYAGDAHRSPQLSHFAPLAICPGVKLYSLQRQHGCGQLAALAGQLPIVDFGPTFDADAAFVDTAAVMMNLDLVITSDTSIAHLAGALGVKVWVALQLVPDWRWLLDRADSPWYPTMRLFRQSRLGDWPEVFERIAAELASQSAARGLS